MAKQRGLGKGLSSLIPANDVKPAEVSSAAAETSRAAEKQDNEDAVYLPIGEVFPNPNQPRKTIDEEHLKELSESIMRHGIIQPILVRKSDDKYQIIAGERRWRAANIVGLVTVPVRVLNISDEKAMELALVENLQREDLSPVEIALGIQDLISKLKLTHEEVSNKIGISRAGVTNKLRLLQLPQEILTMLEAGEITEGHARTLLSIDDREKQMEFALLCRDRGTSVRQLEELIKQFQMAQRLSSVLPEKEKEPERSEFQDEIDNMLKKYNLTVKVAGSRRNMGILIKGLRKWQIQLLLEYIENNNEELFPRE